MLGGVQWGSQAHIVAGRGGGPLPAERKLELLRGVIADLRLFLRPLAESTPQAVVSVILCQQLRMADKIPLVRAVALQLHMHKTPRSQTRK